MMLTTTALLTKWTNIDHLVTARVMQRLTGEIIERFSEAHNKLLAEINAPNES